MKTIATISTPNLAGAIGIIRMSGDNALAIADKMFCSKKLGSMSQAMPNYMYLGQINANNVKDRAFAVYFKAPHSYTGEDVVEFHCHGGVKLINEILNACIANGASVADKGEFTKRAFLNGKIALSDAEGIIDIINAESVAALNAAHRLLGGGIAEKVDVMQNKLLDCISELEASLDYPEEMEEESKNNTAALLEQLIVELRDFEQTARVGQVLKHGIAVAIVGQANVGKSSLLNCLLGTERAIVTDIAGTTRDSVEESIEVDGILLRLIDTAGIRNTEDKVEALGVERSIKIANSSDIVLFLTHANRKLNKEEQELLAQLDKQVNQKRIMVYNKSDLGVLEENKNGVIISCKNRQGLEQLRQKIVEMFHVKHLDANANIITNQRHKNAISKAIENIESAQAVIGNAPTECLLVDLRTAYFALGEITGNTASEAIIDSIFSKFCLGK